jgi:hypothetical protein
MAEGHNDQRPNPIFQTKHRLRKVKENIMKVDVTGSWSHFYDNIQSVTIYNTMYNHYQGKQARHED